MNHENNDNWLGKKEKKVKAGGFQGFGLSRSVLTGVLRKGYNIPTPIQRKTIPVILEGKDVVAMARTGSGKTAAFLVPLFEKLQIPSTRKGVRALVLSPTRELAMQTLAFAKDLGKYTDVKAAVILGGDSFDEQFDALHKNPDLVIATPGRLVHLVVEMNYQFTCVEYVVFDEADRLFEMGFYDQIKELTKRLPDVRQTLLFSATLPKLLVEFAQAGLTEPVLIRLDTETKVSENLKQTFFYLTPDDRIALLLHLLNNIIDKNQQTVVFVPTKNHVEYLHKLLDSVGIENTYIYSSLDPDARKINVNKFRSRKVNYLVVTDLAARGIDIPFLDNVINFNFPCKPKLFVHRVGRVARAGRSGTAYTFVSPDELPYLFDLQLFLNVELKYAKLNETDKNTDWHLLVGKIPQIVIDDNKDFAFKKHDVSFDLNTLHKALHNANSKYIRTRPMPSKESIKRAKNSLIDENPGFHPLLTNGDTTVDLDDKRIDLLNQLKNVRPKSTIFEVKKPGRKQVKQVPFMEEIRAHDRKSIERFNQLKEERRSKLQEKGTEQIENRMEAPTEEDLGKIFHPNKKNKPKFENSNANKNYFIPYASSDAIEESGYSLTSSFERETSRVSLDLMQDEIDNPNKQTTQWDRNRKKYITQGPKQKKIKTESGVWISASYKSDIYDKWKSKMNKNEDTEEKEGTKELDKRKKKGFITLNSKQSRGRHPLLKGKPVNKEALKEMIPLEKRVKIQKRSNRIKRADRIKEMKNKERRNAAANKKMRKKK